MLDEQADLRLVVNALHVDLWGNQLVGLVLLTRFLFILPVSLFHVGNDSAEVGLLLLNSLRHHVVLIETDGWRQVLRFQSATRKVLLVWWTQIWRDLPTKEFFEAPKIHHLVLISSFLSHDILQDFLSDLDNLFGRRMNRESVELWMKVDIFDSSSGLSGPIVVFTIKIQADFVIPILLILHLLSCLLLVLHVLFVLSIRVIIRLIIIFILANVKRVVAVLRFFPDHLILNQDCQVRTDEHDFSFLVYNKLDLVDKVLPSNINFQIFLLLIFQEQISLPGRI